MEIAYEKALGFELEEKYIDALEIINEAERSGNSSELLNVVQAEIFMSLGKQSENLDKKLVFLMAATEAYTRNNTFDSVYPLFQIAELLGSSSFYKRVLKTAKFFLNDINTTLGSQERDVAEDDGVYGCLLKQQTKLGSLVDVIEERIANHVVPVPFGDFKPEVIEMKKENGDMVERLRPHWEDSSEDTKREFMKVSAQELRRYVLDKYKKDGKDALEKVLSHVKKKERWVFWLCRSCSEKFSTSEECTSHLEQVHAAEFRPSSRNDLVERVSAVWSDKIVVGVWKPVDEEAAVELIKKDATAFKRCKEWPLAEDEDRSEVLSRIQSLLVTLSKHKIIPQSIRDRMKHDVVKKLEALGVSGQAITDSGLLQTPKSICFLPCPELNQILDFLSDIRCNREDALDLLVCSAVESFCGGTRVKEKIDFDSNFAYLLLDKRLLQGKIENARFDDVGKISFVDDANVHCSRALAGGDDFLSWLAVSGDERFRFPGAITANNLDVWMASLRSYEFVCRTLKTMHAKKMELHAADPTLISNNKVIHVESKILLNENWRIEIVKHLTRLCKFDLRSYLNLPLKQHLLTSLQEMFIPAV